MDHRSALQTDHHIVCLGFLPRQTWTIYKDAVDWPRPARYSFQDLVPPTPAPKPIPFHRPEASASAREAAADFGSAPVEMPPPAADPKKTLVRSEVAAIPALKTFSTCPVPIHAVLNRETYGDGHREYWMLLDTKPIVRAAESAMNMDPSRH